ncbi:MAG: HK97 gp10 family phage protein [Clostridia bacterium]|nr:HK97 gp10 family phage protein [Clostridia bacterium]
MADNVVFEDYTIKCQNAIKDAAIAGLEEATGELESAVKRNTRVDTGQTKNSWRHIVDDDTLTGTVGSELENAIWEEFGTGEHSLNGNGRKGGWHYKDAKGEWHFTIGKKPSRAFFKAFTAMKAKIIQIIEDKLKGL